MTVTDRKTLTVVENKNGRNNESKVPSSSQYKNLKFVFQCKCLTHLLNEKYKLISRFKFLAKNKTKKQAVLQLPVPLSNYCILIVKHSIIYTSLKVLEIFRHFTYTLGPGET